MTRSWAGLASVLTPPMQARGCPAELPRLSVPSSAMREDNPSFRSKKFRCHIACGDHSFQCMCFCVSGNQVQHTTTYDLILYTCVSFFQY